MKCGHVFAQRPGMLVAGESQSARVAPAQVAMTARPGGFFPRLIAFIVDTFLLSMILLIIYLLWTAQLTPLKIEPKAGLNKFAIDALGQRLGLVVAVVVVHVFYYVGSWSILNGSPGQRVMSLQIVRKDGPLSFGGALLRYLFKFPSNIAGLLGTGALLIGIAGTIDPAGLLAPVVLLIEGATALQLLFWAISLVTVPFSKTKRAVHDSLAGTFVIQHLDPEAIMEASSAPRPAAATAGPYVGPVAVGVPPATVPAPSAVAPFPASSRPEIPSSPASPPPPDLPLQAAATTLAADAVAPPPVVEAPPIPPPTMELAAPVEPPAFPTGMPDPAPSSSTPAPAPAAAQPAIAPSPAVESGVLPAPSDGAGIDATPAFDPLPQMAPPPASPTPPASADREIYSPPVSLVDGADNGSEQPHPYDAPFSVAQPEAPPAAPTAPTEDQPPR